MRINAHLRVLDEIVNLRVVISLPPSEDNVWVLGGQHIVTAAGNIAKDVFSPEG